MLDTPTSLYLHIPFCEQKCPYCAFNSTAGYTDSLIDRYLKALLLELQSLQPAPGEIETIYIGGGTPTSLDEHQLSRLLSAITSNLALRNLREFTVEVNPGTITEAKAAVLAGGGVNRISMGVQSLDSDFLKLLGRIHTAEDVGLALYLLRNQGIKNFNLDLIYGLPGQSTDQWNSDVDGILSLSTQHLSFYCLQYETGTNFKRRNETGELLELEDDQIRAMFSSARSKLRDHGFDLYEISNFAKPGCQSLHNLNYWSNNSYYGVGAGAFSRISNRRTMNTKSILGYISNIENNEYHFEEDDTLTPEDDYVETFSTMLRTTDGADLDIIHERTGIDPERLHGQFINQCVDKGLALIDKRHMKLSEDGLWVLDSILQNLFVSAR